MKCDMHVKMRGNIEGESLPFALNQVAPLTNRLYLNKEFMTNSQK